jgi:virulence-associated protein VagC
MTVAKVFRNGRSQAIRLRKEFRVDTSEVYLKRTREGFLVIPRGRTPRVADVIYVLDTDTLIYMSSCAVFG